MSDVLINTLVLPLRATYSASHRIIRPSRSVAKILAMLSHHAVKRMQVLELTTAVHIGGYVTRVVNEHLAWLSCSCNMAKPKTNSHLHGLTNHRDRGGLPYPSDELINLLNILKIFAADVLSCNVRNWRPVERLAKLAKPAVCDSPLLVCLKKNEAHRRELARLICTKFYG